MGAKLILNPDLYNLDYPLGPELPANLSKIHKMAETFLTIKEFKDKPITLICKGQSGLIVASILADKIPNANIHFVRNPGDKHTTRGMTVPGRINVMTDDFIASGATMNDAWEQVGKPHIHCVLITADSREGNLHFSPDYIVCREK